MMTRLTKTYIFGYFCLFSVWVSPLLLSIIIAVVFFFASSFYFYVKQSLNIYVCIIISGSMGRHSRCCRRRRPHPISITSGNFSILCCILAICKMRKINAHLKKFQSTNQFTSCFCIGADWIALDIGQIDKNVLSTLIVSLVFFSLSSRQSFNFDHYWKNSSNFTAISWRFVSQNKNKSASGVTVYKC